MENEHKGHKEQTKSKGLIALQEYNDKVKSGEIERTAPNG